MIFAAQSFRRNRRKHVPKTPLFHVRDRHPPHLFGVIARSKATRQSALSGHRADAQVLPRFCSVAQVRIATTGVRTGLAMTLRGARRSRNDAEGRTKPAASLGEAAGSYIIYYAFLLRRMPMRMHSRPNAVIIGTGHHRRPVWGRFSSGGLSGGDLGSLPEFCRVKVVVCKLSFEV